MSLLSKVSSSSTLVSRLFEITVPITDTNHSCREGGMEARHSVGSIRDGHYHPGRHLLQQQTQSRLAH